MTKTLKEHLREHEAYIVGQTLKANGGDRARSAEILGITLRTLNKIIERNGLTRARFAKPLPIPVGRTDDDREA